MRLDSDKDFKLGVWSRHSMDWIEGKSVRVLFPPLALRELCIGQSSMSERTLFARKLGAHKIIGLDVVQEKMDLARKLNLCNHVLPSNEEAYETIRTITAGIGVDLAVDCSAHPAARNLAIRSTGKWGRIVFLGEGGPVSFDPSPDLMHGQKTLYGSWVSSIWRMEELLDKLVSWNLHPDRLITHHFPLDKVSDAYAIMAEGKSGKIAVCSKEELSELSPKSTGAEKHIRQPELH